MGMSIDSVLTTEIGNSVLPHLQLAARTACLLICALLRCNAYDAEEVLLLSGQCRAKSGKRHLHSTNSMGRNGSLALQDLKGCEVRLCCVMVAFERLNVSDRRDLPSGEAQIIRSATRIFSAMESPGAAGEKFHENSRVCSDSSHG